MSSYELKKEICESLKKQDSTVAKLIYKFFTINVSSLQCEASHRKLLKVGVSHTRVLYTNRGLLELATVTSCGHQWHRNETGQSSNTNADVFRRQKQLGGVAAVIRRVLRGIWEERRGEATGNDRTRGCIEERNSHGASLMRLQITSGQRGAAQRPSQMFSTTIRSSSSR